MKLNVEMSKPRKCDPNPVNTVDDEIQRRLTMKLLNKVFSKRAVFLNMSINTLAARNPGTNFMPQFPQFRASSIFNLRCVTFTITNLVKSVVPEVVNLRPDFVFICCKAAYSLSHKEILNLGQGHAARLLP